MKELIGKKVNSIKIYGDFQRYIEFETDNGIICYEGVGDCCSETYFSNIWNPQNILDEVIEEVETMELMDGEYPNRKSRQDVDSVYGIKLIVGKKEYLNSKCCVILFRNSSNGYYGGEYELTQEIPEEAKKKEWMINKDWEAPEL